VSFEDNTNAMNYDKPPTPDCPPPPSGNPVRGTALDLLRAGFCPIPVRPDGSKAPQLPSWDEFNKRRPTEPEVDAWFAGGRCGIAIVGGPVSGNLLVLDFEFLDFFEEWLALVEAQAPGLAARLPTVRTPGKDEAGGRHVYARSSGPAVATGKLARITRAEAERRTGDPGKTTAVEVKAEKGYVLTVGCPAACHPSGRLYEHISGRPVKATPTLTESEVALLLDSARALERGDKASGDKKTEPASGDANRPGDDFNRRADWKDVLGPGWKTVRENGDVLYLCRPGKDAGVSATVGYCRSERAGPKLYVFSTNAEPFEPEKSYSKFEAYTLLNHKGDFKAAARDLGKQGYGDQARNGRSRAKPTAPAEGEADRLTLGPLTLTLGRPRQSPSGKLTVPVTVYQDDVLVYQFLLTNAASGRKEPARVLKTLLPEGDPAAAEIDAVLTKLIGQAAARLAPGTGGGGPPAPGGTLCETVAAYVGDHFRPTRRVGRRVYLSALGQDFDQPSFLHLVNTDLLDACRAAAGDQCQEEEYTFRKMVASEMRVVFGDLLTTLPQEEPDDVPMHRGDRQALADAVIAMWSVPKCLTKTRDRDGNETTVNVSLLGQARAMLASGRVPADRWARVHPAHRAFARRHVVADDATGEVTADEVLLAFNAELAVSTGVRLPDGVNSFNLFKRGEKAEVFRKLPPGLPKNANRTDGGDTRLIVLSRRMMTYLLDDASPDDGQAYGEKKYTYTRA
jgi:hypothetical protein